jgi:hypothetical protein
MALLAVAQKGIGSITYGDTGLAGPANIPVAVLPRRDVFGPEGVIFLTVIHVDPAIDLGTRPIQGNDQLVVTQRAGFNNVVSQTYVLRNVDRPTAIPALALVICTSVSSP